MQHYDYGQINWAVPEINLELTFVLPQKVAVAGKGPHCARPALLIVG
jgi:hypothetical protein